MNSETVDLIYLDPPFNSNKNYAAPIGSKAAGAEFQDTWSLDDVKKEWVEEIEADNTATWSAITVAGYVHGESSQAYLTYMAIRLLEMRRILKPTGSIYLHCDPTMSHYLKLLMDAIFGKSQFLNEIVWHYRKWSTGKYAFQKNHDVVLYYCRVEARRKERVFNQLYMDRAESTRKRFGEGKIRSGYDTYGRRIPSVTKGKSKGVRQDDVWNIRRVAPIKQHYPTEKPLALLHRIVKASSNEGDIVLDPFCGCATTCIAAESLGRRWVGIDVEEKARDLVLDRLREEVYVQGFLGGVGGLKEMPKIYHLHRPPRRTDPDAPKRSRNIKRVLYKLQQGRCVGVCGSRKLDIDLFEIDHVRPRSKGGTDTDENLQLLCSTCNRRKGSKAMARFLELMEE